MPTGLHHSFFVLVKKIVVIKTELLYLIKEKNIYNIYYLKQQIKT